MDGHQVSLLNGKVAEGSDEGNPLYLRVPQIADIKKPAIKAGFFCLCIPVKTTLT